MREFYFDRINRIRKSGLFFTAEYDKILALIPPSSLGERVQSRPLLEWLLLFIGGIR